MHDSQLAYDDMIGEYTLDPYDDPWLEEERPAIILPEPTSVSIPKPPPRGDCDQCGHKSLGMKGYYCSRSGQPIKTNNALKSCEPVLSGNPYIPVSLR